MRAPYDRHAFITDLIDSGLPSQQAEAIATGFEARTTQALVTTTAFDLAMLRIENRFKDLETRLETRFERVMTELTWCKWTGGPLLLVIVGFLVTLVLRR